MIEIPAHFSDAHSSISISPSGRDLSLASRSGIWLFDMDNPYSSPRQLPVAANLHNLRCEWHTFQSYEELIASSYSNTLQIWNVSYWNPSSLQETITAHNRVVTDIEWSLFDPNILCSSSIDTFVHLWDIRFPRHSARSFCSYGKPVKKSMWNRKNEFLFASLHDAQVSMWDVRFGSRPAKVFDSGKKANIQSIDWSHVAGNNLLLYENCGKIKPFGDGIVWATTRPSYDVCVVNLNQPEDIHSICSSNLALKEFAWRVSRGNVDSDRDDREYHLICWGNDLSLKEWDIEHRHLCGGKSYQITRTDLGSQMEAKTFQLHQLPHDFDLVSESLSLKLREQNESPILKSVIRRRKLSGFLVGDQPQSISEMGVFDSHDDIEEMWETNISDGRTGVNNDVYNVPVMLGCVGCFTGGILHICSVTPDNLICIRFQDKFSPDAKIPPSPLMDDGVKKLEISRTSPIAGYRCRVNIRVIDMADYLPYRKGLSESLEYCVDYGGDCTVEPLKISDVFDNTIDKGLVGKSNNDVDNRTWSVLRKILEILGDVGGYSPSSIFAKNALKIIIDHYTGCNNIQMLAIISAKLLNKLNRTRKVDLPKFMSLFNNTAENELIHSRPIAQARPKGMEEHPPVEQNLVDGDAKQLHMICSKNIRLPLALRAKLYAPCVKPPRVLSSYDSGQDDETLISKKLCNSYLTLYSDLLSRWGHTEKVAELFKLAGLRLPSESVTMICPDCETPLKHGACPECEKVVITCVVCRKKLVGLSPVCPKCAHTGHLACVKKWFQQEHMCAAGCGCNCSF